MCKKIVFFFSILLFVLSLGQSVRGELIAYYPMNEGDGTTVADKTGNHDAGTIEGDATWVDGPPGMGKALSFTGGGDKVSLGTWNNVGSYDAATNTGAMTIAAWMKETSEPTGFANPISKREAFTETGMMWQFEISANNGYFRFHSNAPGALSKPEPLEVDQWYHVAVTVDTTGLGIMYIDGVEVARRANFNFSKAVDVDICIGANANDGFGFPGIIDDVQFYDTALTAEEIPEIMAGISFSKASKPNPEDEAIDVSIDTSIIWKQGEFARTHDIYFSPVIENVNDAEADNPLDVLLKAGHDVNNYDLDRLDYAQTYYWRIDEVNGAPDYTVYKGDVWSFTTELFYYPIRADRITVSASSSAEGQGAENSINGSGLDSSTNQHTNYAEDMWLSEVGDPTPWIQYEFDTVYKLNHILVWNYNGEFPNNFFGASDVTVEYSADGENWETSDVTEFTQAPGTVGYEPDNTIEIGDAPVKYVKISINKNQADESLAAFFSSAGLSEVVFFAVPVQARYPVPEEGAVDVNIFSPTLSWTAGRGAAEHNVNFDGISMATGLTETSYTIPMTLDLSTTYQWSVDEVNGADVWPGSAWSFTTMDYIVVEDFEDYNDTVGSRVYDNAWLDGYDIPSNGALIGYGELPIMETEEVYAGDQSAPVYFDNTSATSSEVYIDPANLAIGRDLSIGSPKALVLWVYGQDPNAATEQLYVKVNNTKILSDVDLTTEDWTAAIFDISGMNLGSVSNLAVGLERKGATGGVGLVYLDEIRLYGSAEAVVEEE